MGLWTFQLDLQPAREARRVAAEVEAQGWGALWVPEAVGREAMSHAGLLLDATDRLVVGTGVANVWSRSATVTAGAQRLLADDSGGRFLLGLGVSHQPMVEGLLGVAYEKPLAKMRAYLDQVDDAFTTSPAPAAEPPRVLAALGPRMLRLAAERAWGALTYFVPVEHTAVAREALGEGPMLMVEMAAVLTDDPAEARDVARRRYTQTYLNLPNYVENLRRLGWGDDDLAVPGSDRLVDALVAWGDAEAIAARVAEHHGVGADHVCLQVLDADAVAVPTAQWAALAEVLVAPAAAPGGEAGGEPGGGTAAARAHAAAAGPVPSVPPASGLVAAPDDPDDADTEPAVRVVEVVKAAPAGTATAGARGKGAARAGGAAKAAKPPAKGTAKAPAKGAGKSRRPTT